MLAVYVSSVAVNSFVLLVAVQTSFVPDKEQYNMTKSQLLAEMDVSMGGRVAEEIVFGPDKVTTGAEKSLVLYSILARITAG